MTAVPPPGAVPAPSAAAPAPPDVGGPARTSAAAVWTFFLHGRGRLALPGLAGMVLLVFGGLGSGALRAHDPLLENLHLSWLRYGHGEIVAGTLVWIGVLLVIASWVRLGRAALAGEVSLRQMTWVVPLWTVPLLVSVPIFSRDAYSYLAQGALLRDGFDPYGVGPVVNPGVLLDNVSTVWTTTTAPYGPGFLNIARLITMFTGDNVVFGTMMLRIFMLPGLALMVWAIPRITRHLGGDPTIALWLAVLNPLVLIHLIGGVHNEVLMVGLMVAGILLVLRRRHLWGIAVIALAVSVKATAGAALPFMVWIWMIHRREDAHLAGEDEPVFWRSFLRTAGLGALTFVAVFAAVSAAAGVGLGWMTALQGSNKIINWLSLPTLIAQLYTVATGWLTGVPLAPVLAVTRMVSAIALVTIVVVVVVRFRHSVRQAMFGVLWTMVAIVLLSPAALPWYYSWPLAVAAGFALSTTTLAWLVGLSVWMMLIFKPDGGIGLYQVQYLVLATVVAVVAAKALTAVDPLQVRRRLGMRPVGAHDPGTTGDRAADGREVAQTGDAPTADEGPAASAGPDTPR